MTDLLPAPIAMRAHAKVNLYLRILGRRPDGYHDLATVFQTLELHDVLEFVPERGRESIQLRSLDPALPDGPDNLVTQAWRLLVERYGAQIPDAGVACRIQKEIPLQAGLGGGSADAAATLAALNRLWRLGLDTLTLRQLALELGSDVPFPFVGGTAFGTGRGEQLQRLAPIPETFLLLAIPPVGVSTKDAFAWWDSAHVLGFDAPDPAEIQQLWQEAILSGSWIQYLHNDFEEVVCAQVPEIAAVRTQLRNRGIPTVLTGSGSALVGMAGTFEDASRILQGWQPVAGERLLLTRTRAEAGIQ